MLSKRKAFLIGNTKGEKYGKGLKQGPFLVAKKKILCYNINRINRKEANYNQCTE